MKMPEHLEEAIQTLTSKNKLNQLHDSYQELSGRYRDVKKNSKALIDSFSQRNAYLAARFPATFAAISRVLQELLRLAPEMEVNHLLDAGAGPGTAMWAAIHCLDGIKKFTLLERDKELIQLGKELIGLAQPEVSSKAEWIQCDLQSKSVLHHDLVICSYVINELDSIEPVVSKLWDAANKYFVVIEPGTPAGFKNIRHVREFILNKGGHIVAPCPSCADCPMKGNDWCHFSQRVSRSRSHRSIKGADLNYEDEKFSYLVFSKTPIIPVNARILRHPIKNPGHVKLTVCSKEGWKQVVVSKKQKEIYKQARHAEWGDEL
jgi:ribosomal protein RSM22 (predicted rRNA methylase)